MLWRAGFSVVLVLAVLLTNRNAAAQQSALWSGFEGEAAQSVTVPGFDSLAQQPVEQVYGSHLNLPQFADQLEHSGVFQSAPPQVYQSQFGDVHQSAPQSFPVQHSQVSQCGPTGCGNRFCLGCRNRSNGWESYGPGQHLGLPRTPTVNDYRLRVNDEIEFVFQANRIQSPQQYRLTIGDTVRVVSAADERLNASSLESGVSIMSDGTISLDIIGPVFAANRTISELQEELNRRYEEFVSNPSITITGISTDTRLRDFLNSVDARAGAGGQSRTARVTRDGTLRLPLIGAVRVVGLTLDELEREVNSRFNLQVPGVRVSVVLSEQAPQFIYVLGEVLEPGQFELNGPTTVTQALALAGGWRNGGKLNEIIVFRRDQDWRLMGLRVNLREGFTARGPLQSDDVWLRDSDVVLIPKRPIVHLADAIELYFTRTLYALFPSELGVFDAQTVNTN